MCEKCEDSKPKEKEMAIHFHKLMDAYSVEKDLDLFSIRNVLGYLIGSVESQMIVHLLKMRAEEPHKHTPTEPEKLQEVSDDDFNNMIFKG